MWRLLAGKSDSGLLVVNELEASTVQNIVRTAAGHADLRSNVGRCSHSDCWHVRWLLLCSHSDDIVIYSGCACS
jgi:hypothetical protein